MREYNTYWFTWLFETGNSNTIFIFLFITAWKITRFCGLIFFCNWSPVPFKCPNLKYTQNRLILQKKNWKTLPLMLVTCCFMKIKANSNLLLKKTMKCKIWIITFKIRHALTVFKTPGQYRNHKTIILELQCTNY